MKNTFKMMAAMLFMGAAMCICACSKDGDGGNNELVGTTWIGEPVISGEDYDLYLFLSVQFTSSTQGTYIQMENGNAKTWNFTYSYSGNTGRVSGAPFNKFTVSGNKLNIDVTYVYGGYTYTSNWSLNKQ